MKERPIIFSTESVRAILDGRKTQTRRVIKPFPECNDYTLGARCESNYGFELRNGQIHCISCGKALCYSYSGQDTIRYYKCPFGIPGDQLWVREQWRKFDVDFDCQCLEPCSCARYGYRYAADYPADEEYGIWKSPMFMPRTLSRITLEIADIHCERLKSISASDCLAEGYESIGKYTDEWNRLNAKRGYDWESNPWVWVLEFKQVNGGAA